MSTLSQATLSEIRTLSKQYADMVSSNFVTDAEWNSYINLAYFELYDLLVQKYGDDYYVAAPYSFTTDGTTQQYTLPSNFYKFMGLDLQLSNSNDSWVTIRPFMFTERNRYAVPNFQSFYGITNVRYRLAGNTLFLTPTPTSGQNFRMWFIPILTELSADTDVVKGISGWQEYLCLDAAIRALIKQELDVSALSQRKQALIARIESAAANRDAGNPQTVSDSRGSDVWQYGGGPWTWGN
jgi:hypothetical protein